MRLCSHNRRIKSWKDKGLAQEGYVQNVVLMFSKPNDEERGSVPYVGYREVWY